MDEDTIHTLMFIRSQLTECTRLRSYYTQGIIDDIDRILNEYIKKIKSGKQKRPEPNNDDIPF